MIMIHEAATSKTARAKARAAEKSEVRLVSGGSQPSVVLHFRSAIGNLQDLAQYRGEQNRNAYPNCQTFNDTHTPSSEMLSWERDSSSIISAAPTVVNAPQSNLHSNRDSSYGNHARMVR